MAHINDIYNSSTHLLPGLTFLIGLSGSIHCLGMCSAISMVCSNTKTDNIFYQLGRLFGYCTLGVISGLLGSYLVIKRENPFLTIIPALLIGAMLIYIGLKQIILKNSHIKFPKFFNFNISKVWSKILKNKSANSKQTSLLIGSISIFLPCGLLYGVVIALAAYQNSFLALVSMLTFWIGTLPAMSFAPSIFKKILNPISVKIPTLTASFFIFTGVITISYRLSQVLMNNSCH